MECLLKGQSGESEVEGIGEMGRIELAMMVESILIDGRGVKYSDYFRIGYHYHHLLVDRVVCLHPDFWRDRLDLSRLEHARASLLGRL